MNPQQIALDVIAELSQRRAEDLRPEMELVADLQIDSPRALQLLCDLEDRLSIEISDQDAAGLDTVGDILDYLATAT